MTVYLPVMTVYLPVTTVYLPVMTVYLPVMTVYLPVMTVIILQSLSVLLRCCLGLFVEIVLYFCISVHQFLTYSEKKKDFKTTFQLRIRVHYLGHIQL